MGIIKAITGTVGGALADQWLEVIEADEMSATTVFTKGVAVRRDDRRGSNRKGTSDVISNGSIIHVYDNQFMMLVDGGRIVDYSAEPGYYQVDDSSSPSLFNGEFGDALKEAFDRFRFGGVPSRSQKVFFVNLQEIRGIKFGTPNPVTYFDNYYGAEFSLRAFGTYSIKITNPILFYQESIARNAAHVDIDDINEHYINEFLTALQTSINKMSVDGERISYLPSKSLELSKYMAGALDEDWRKLRGMEILTVSIPSISYDEDSQRRINEFGEAAMYGKNAAAREAYVQTRVARGLEAAGSNPGGAGVGYLGVGMGMQAGGGFMAGASQTNMQQMQQDQAAQQQAQQQGQAAQGAPGGQPAAAGADQWFCGECGHPNQGGKFCTNCGTKRPVAEQRACPSCGHEIPAGQNPRFCTNCGQQLQQG